MPRVWHIGDPERPKDAAYIGRAGKSQAGPWGNEYSVAAYGRGGALQKYENDVKLDPSLRARLREHLAGRDLYCFCAPRGGVTADDPLVCHGQIILRCIAGWYD